MDFISTILYVYTVIMHLPELCILILMHMNIMQKLKQEIKNNTAPMTIPAISPALKALVLELESVM